MRSKSKDNAKKILIQYLEKGNRRKTPERFAILDVVYDSKQRLSLNQILQELEQQHFPLARNTVTATLRLFANLHIVDQVVLPSGTFYERPVAHGLTAFQLCNSCGNTTEYANLGLLETVGKVPQKQFHMERATVFFYGICAKCYRKQLKQKQLTRK